MTYSVAELLSPPNSQYVYTVQAVNNVGQSAGIGTTTSPFIPPGTAIRTTPGAASQDIGVTLGVQVASVGGINSSGQVAGNLIVSGSVRAARYTNGAGWQNLGTLP